MLNFLNVEKLNRLGFIRFSSTAQDLKYRLCSIIAKTPFEIGCNSLFYTNIDNGFWDIQCPRNPELAHCPE